MENINTKGKILIVDDEPANIYLLDGVLTEEGFETKSASNGQDALEMIIEYSPDVILLDIMMPGITGIDVLEKIMDDPQMSIIPVIMISARSEAEDVELALNKGAIEYIKKPINEVEMLARLRTVLRLKRNEDHLRDLLRSKEEFIHMVSHDVRAPFLSITGLAELLLNDPDLILKMNTEHKELLTLIINSSNFIIDYFNKLLHWSELGSNELILSKEWINLNNIFKTSKVLFSLRLEEKKQQCEIECENDIKIFADISYFQQLINNLISNACKYTPDNGTIKLYLKKTDHSTYVFIKDSGIGLEGISDEELFGKEFHKSTRGTKGEKGTGLGLRICKRISDAHGFNISYTSVPGSGTEFIIEIPN